MRARIRRLISRSRVKPWSTRQQLCKDNSLPRGQNLRGSGSFTRTATSVCVPRKRELPNWKINSRWWVERTRVHLQGMRTQGDSLYPSIRKLPLLGVPYADLYRKTKVEEAVFETLTKEYRDGQGAGSKRNSHREGARSTQRSRKKVISTSPPVYALGRRLALACGVTWVFGRTAWEQTDPADPGSILAQEVFDTVKKAMPWASRNGAGLHTDSR